MFTDDPFVIYMLLLSNTVLLGAAAIAILRLQRTTVESAQFWSSPTGDALEAQNAEKNARPEKIEQHVAAMQATVERLEKKDRSTRPILNVPIENAVRMARGGASVEELTRNCGLNIGEARLVQRLHSNQTGQKVQTP